MNTGVQEPVVRSQMTVLAYRLNGLCQALRLLGQFNLPVTQQVIVMFKKIEADWLSDTHGRCVEAWPTTNEVPSLSELITKCEIMREVQMAFMTPEEREETRRPEFGFAAKTKQSN